jgi:chromosome partitioning protein
LLQERCATSAILLQSRSARVVAIFNHKGGTAKTTTAVNVAAGLAARNKRVLLVDTDGQGNVGVSLKLEFERSLYHVIVMGLDYRDAIVKARANLDVLPANETLAAAELYLSGRQNRDRVLKERLGDVREAYDFVIVDCSPSLSLLNQNALVMSDALLCPVACDYLALVGVRQVLRTLRHVNQFLRHPLELFGVLPTLFDARVRICQESYETLKEHFKDRCLAPIRQSSKLKEAPSTGKPLREYAPQSPAMADYEAVVEHLINENRSAVRVGLRAGEVA